MKRDETGMALVSVLLIVALAAALLAIMLSGEDASLQRATRLTEAARARAVARGGEASAITALRRDMATAPASDDASEAWAHIGDRDTPIAGGRFSLAIADASGKIDLNPLVHGDPVTRQRLSVLANALDLPADSAQRIADLLVVTGPIADIAELAPAGLAPDAIARLATATTALPTPAAINLNAASEPVLALLVDNPMAAHALVARRQRQGRLTPADFAAEHARVPPGTGFTSHFYWVRVRVTIGDTAQQLASLLERRQAPNGVPQVVAIGRWQGNAIPAQARSSRLEAHATRRYDARMLHPFPADQDAFAASDAFLAERILAQQARLGRPILVGLCGAQGSGKSHTAGRLVERLETSGHHAVALSIDDFYLTRAARRDLGHDVHPLLATRGVPGTHDVALAQATLTALLAGDSVALPSFDKSRDDRVPRTEWTVSKRRPDVVLLEGWCIGARPEPAEALIEPINRLEADEDPDGAWRTYVNRQLSGPYADLFARFDLGILLRAPSFDQVFGWRTEQEARLDRTPGAPPPMDAAALQRFIAHYERITRHILSQEPADIVIPLAPDRKPQGWRLSTGDGAA